MMLGTTNPELVQEEAKDEKATNIVYKKKK